MRDMPRIADIIKMAREYQRTKSISTASEVCRQLAQWADCCERQGVKVEDSK